MKGSRPIAALLVSFLVLHLTVLAGLAGALESHGMPHMDGMQDAPAAGMEGMPAPAESPASDEEACSDEAPCEMPGMPGHCPSLASCTIAVLPVHQEIAAHAPLPAPALIVPFQIPHTLTSPPDTPPPRA